LFPSDAGQTVLHLSASLGLEQLSKALLVRGVEFDQGDVNRYTALHFAALWGHIDCVRCLVYGGADADLVDTEDLTPLQIASDSNHSAIAEFLEAHKRDAVTKDYINKSYFHSSRDTETLPKESIVKGRKRNTISLYEKVFDKDRSLTAHWTQEEFTDKNSERQWKTTLTVILPDGSEERYIGTGRQKGPSKDAVAYSYLLTKGFITESPSS